LRFKVRITVRVSGNTFSVKRIFRSHVLRAGMLLITTPCAGINWFVAKRKEIQEIVAKPTIELLQQR